MVSELGSGSSAPGSSPGGDISFYSWATHLYLTMPLSTQVYKLMGTGKFNAGGNPATKVRGI